MIVVTDVRHNGQPCLPNCIVMEFVKFQETGNLDQRLVDGDICRCNRWLRHQTMTQRFGRHVTAFYCLSLQMCINGIISKSGPKSAIAITVILSSTFFHFLSSKYLPKLARPTGPALNIIHSFIHSFIEQQMA